MVTKGAVGSGTPSGERQPSRTLPGLAPAPETPNGAPQDASDGATTLRDLVPPQADEAPKEEFNPERFQAIEMRGVREALRDVKPEALPPELLKDALPLTPPHGVDVVPSTTSSVASDERRPSKVRIPVRVAWRLVLAVLVVGLSTVFFIRLTREPDAPSVVPPPPVWPEMMKESQTTPSPEERAGAPSSAAGTESLNATPAASDERGAPTPSSAPGAKPLGRPRSSSSKPREMGPRASSVPQPPAPVPPRDRSVLDGPIVPIED